MLYTKPSFTLPTCGKLLTHEQYEIATGVRCHTCRKRFDVCECPNPDVFTSPIPQLIHQPIQ